jgi:sugar lactone lactonase YvrE
MSNRIPSFNLATARLGISALSTVITLGACSHQEDAGPAAPQAPGTPAAPANVLIEPPPAPATAAAAPASGPQAPQVDPPVVLKDMGFKTPESVLYDPEQDLYLVSNVNGKPLDVDSNGFISKVSPEGKVVDLMWIDGSKKASSLNAPKGLTISGNVLYVADINVVRMFDRKTGAAKGKLAIPGATFLNDVATGPDGTVYVSDTGLKQGKDILEGTGTDSIYKIVKGTRVEKVIADKEFGKPNGLLADDTGVWAVTFGSGELVHVDNTGKKEPGQKLPAGTLDGIVKLSDGTMLASSWAASAIFRGTPGGTFEAIIHDVKSPADIGYDTKRNVVLVPLFQADTVVLQKLPGVAPAPSAPVAATPATGGPATAAAAAVGAPKPAQKAPAAAPPSPPQGAHATPMSAPVGAPATPAAPAATAPAKPTPPATPAKAATPPAPPATPAKAATPPVPAPAAPTAPKK